MRRSVALSPNSASPTTAVTVNPAARTWRSSVKANCHFGANRTRRGNPGPRPLARRQPLLGQIQRRAQQPRPRARPQRDRDRRLAIRDLAARAAVLPRDADRGRALFRESSCRRESGRRVRSGTRARSRFHTASASHGACVMKC